MTRQGFYIGHIARTQYFLSIVLEERGEMEDCKNNRDEAIAKARLLKGPDWKVENGEKDFDELVFFHDR